MKKKKDKLTKMRRKARREKQKEQGYFDGRFAPKTHKNKKSYDRKKKDDLDWTDS